MRGSDGRPNNHNSRVERCSAKLPDRMQGDNHPRHPSTRRRRCGAGSRDGVRCPFLKHDPYGEQDFGSFQNGDETIFWKFDYYDQTLTAGSEDPSDPAVTIRVLTIMFASEY